jgi:hypothetical protein
VTVRKTSNVRNLTGEQRSDLLRSLRFPEADERQVAIKSSHEMTCEWFLNSAEYKKWSTPSKLLKSEDTFLWVSGGAGSGKSTIMKHTCTYHRTRHRDHTVVAFFFDAQGTELQKTVKGMYRSLLHQIVERLEKVPCEIQVLDQWTEGKLSAWTVPALQELFGYLVSLLDRPLFCYVDGLDECSSSEVRDTIAFFNSFSQACLKNQTIARTCFANNQISRIYNLEGHSVFLEDQDGHDQDLLRYVEHNFHIGHAKFAQDIHRALARKATGIFLWAVLVVAILNTEFKSVDRKILERIDSIPADLTGLYRRILVQQSREDALLLCLQSVLHAKAPQTPKDLYLKIISDTITTDPRTLIESVQNPPSDDELEAFLRNSSAGLLEITGVAGTATVRFVHPSISHFLLNDEGVNRMLEDHKPVSEGTSFDRLKDCCLDVMDLADIPSPGNEDETEQVLENLRYAVENVLYYANKAEREGVTQVPFLQAFPLLHWIELANTLWNEPQYTPRSSLLYILAEQDVAELVAIHPSRFFYLEPEQELYRTPLFVTLAKKNLDTIQEFFRIELEAPHQPVHFFDQQSKQQKYDELCQEYIQMIENQQVEFLHGLCSAPGHMLPNYNAVLSYMMEPGHEILHLFLLLTGKINMDPLDEKTATLFRWCTKQDLVEFVQLFFEEGTCDLNGEDGFTALMLAAEEGSRSVIVMLLSKGIESVNRKDENGATPLSMALSRGNNEVARILLASGRVVGPRSNLEDQPTSQYTYREHAVPGTAEHRQKDAKRTPVVGSLFQAVRKFKESFRSRGIQHERETADVRHLQPHTLAGGAYSDVHGRKNVQPQEQHYAPAGDEHGGPRQTFSSQHATGLPYRETYHDPGTVSHGHNYKDPVLSESHQGTQGNQETMYAPVLHDHGYDAGCDGDFSEPSEDGDDSGYEDQVSRHDFHQGGQAEGFDEYGEGYDVSDGDEHMGETSFSNNGYQG